MVSAVFAPLMLCRIGKQECFFLFKIWQWFWSMSASFYIIYATETKDTIQNEENGPLNFESKHRISFILPAEIGHRFKNIYITCANF